MDKPLIFGYFDKIVLKQREDEDGRLLGRNDTASKKQGSEKWKIPFYDYSSFDGELPQGDKRNCFNFQEIISLPDFVRTVPQTDTGGLVLEYQGERENLP